MSKTIISLTVLFAVASLSACASTSNLTDENYKKLGHANHLNIAVQAITPSPELKENTYIPADRDRVRAAREAYKNGKVKALVIESGLSE